MISRRSLLAAAPAAVLLPAFAARAATPQRVVVAGGALTEMVYALGAADKLVGVDTTSLYPQAADKLPKIGYFRQLSAEGILSLDPHLLLISDQAGPPATIERLRAIKLPTVVVPETLDAEDIPEKFRAVGKALDLAGLAEKHATALGADIGALSAAVAKLPKRPKVLFLMSVSDGRLLAAGHTTSADTMIRLAGGRNAITEHGGYKSVSAEAAFGASPDIILLSDQSLEAMGGMSGLRKLPQLASIPAAREGRVVTMDILYLLGLGPRVARAGRDLAAAFHPGADLSIFAR